MAEYAGDTHLDFYVNIWTFLTYLMLFHSLSDITACLCQDWNCLSSTLLMIVCCVWLVFYSRSVPLCKKKCTQNNKISSQTAFLGGKWNANLSSFLDYGRGMEDERFPFSFFHRLLLRMQTSISDHLSWCLSYAKSNLCTVTDTVGCCRFALYSWTISSKQQTN